MHALKILCLTVIQLVRQAWAFPHTVATALKDRRQQVLLKAHEVDRLDRIRNPSKCVGK
jgi:hypothetical protein